MAAALRDLIRQKRVRNEEGHWFIPHGVLDSCVTSQSVFGCLEKCKIDAWDLEQLTNTVTQGWKKVFAVLVLIRREADIVCFVEDDGFQDQDPDSKIPIALKDLERVVGDAAEEFFEEQWRFAAPKFTRHLTHRYLQDETILPFTSSRLLGRGGFGQVYGVSISPGHHDYHLNSIMMPSEIQGARKELDIAEDLTAHDPKATWAACGSGEHRALSALHHMGNPNILELLASYTYRGKHYLLFPLVQTGDLQAFLASEGRPPGFTEDASIWKALAGIAWALETIHSYSSSMLGLKMIGYHHDINPKNILVSDDRFILSDFGLAKLEVREDSKTKFRVGRGFYLAPECELFQSNFEKGSITRASDVWSLGCVLLELIIFMHYGCKGVQTFRDDRKLQIPNYTTRTFFIGDSVNPAVSDWIRKIEDTGDVTSQKAARLVKGMLSIGADDRPRAGQVKAKLRLLSVEASWVLVKAALDALLESLKTFDIFLEVERFKAWGSIFDLNVHVSRTLEPQAVETLRNDLEFPSTILALQKLRDCAFQRPAPNGSIKSVSFHLRTLIDELFGYLTHDQQQKATSILETVLLSKLHGADCPLISDWPSYLDIGYREAAKQLRILEGEASSDPGKDLLVRRDALRDWEPFQAFIKARLFREEEQTFTPVLIEWIVYDVHWAGEVGKKLFKRIGTLVDLLRNSAQLFPILTCLAYFHAPERRAFGIVYEIPSQRIPDIPELFSLFHFISSSKDVRHRPMLEELFGFAHGLAQALVQFHKVGWLHKSLNSYNIVFVREQSHDSVAVLHKFRIVGFNHSRPDHPDEYSGGAWSHSDKSRMYQDPQYLQTGPRYSPEHDYFSFGLILLEVGMWKCLDAMLPQVDQDGKTGQEIDIGERTEYLLAKWVPLLGPRMGRRYRDVVDKCLRKSLNGIEYGLQAGLADTAALHDQCKLAFESDVVQELGRCTL